MHPTDDVHARGAQMVARAIAASGHEVERGPIVSMHQHCEIPLPREFRRLQDIRALAASDAALARAIDAVN